MECSICIDYTVREEAIVTQCGHVFCKQCLVGHLEHLKLQAAPTICPNCRADIKEKELADGVVVSIAMCYGNADAPVGVARCGSGP